MANYITSSFKKPRGKPRRYLVTYQEDCPNGEVITFTLTARLASEATMKVIEFIQELKIHGEPGYGYTLYPVLESKKEADFIID